MHGETITTDSKIKSPHLRLPLGLPRITAEVKQQCITISSHLGSLPYLQHRRTLRYCVHVPLHLHQLHLAIQLNIIMDLR